MTASSLASYAWVLIPIVIIACYKPILRLFFGMVIISEDCVGIVNKKFVVWGDHKTLPDGTIIALNGEAGFQADTLAPGLHWGFWVWQYSITREHFTEIEEGHIGVVEARDGKALSGGRVLARQVECDSFQSARAFLMGNGERGPQITIIPPGTYRINTALFTISPEKVTEIDDTMVGIVTTREGKVLAKGEIAGSEIADHNAFQDGQKFIDGGGYKGLQEQVLLAGRYYLNPRFATVESVKMFEVPIAHVGVVIAYVGKAGTDVTGDAFKHGNLVNKDEKGVWVEPLDPGMYPINPFTHKVELVPTANVVLNWANDKSEAHKLDEKLCSITVRSSDGFKFNLDVSQIIHIPRSDAPKVIARFGSVLNLVTQVLEPTIGNYFRNSAQGSDILDFLLKRAERQTDARDKIQAALKEFNVGAVDTLIGDIVPPEELMKTLTDRKLAEQAQLTFATQRKAAEIQKDLEQAKAMASTQATVVTAERQVQIKDFEAQAAIKQAGGAAESKKLNASADAMVIEITGKAEAAKIKAIGESDAAVIKLKIESMDAGNYAIVQVAQALATNHIKLVPDIMVTNGGANGSGSGTIADMLLAGMLRDQVKKNAEQAKPETPAAGGQA